MLLLVLARMNPQQFAAADERDYCMELPFISRRESEILPAADLTFLRDNFLNDVKSIL